MMRKLLSLLRLAPLALLFASLASAQTTGTIIGVVTDASTGKPVVGALVVATSKSLQGEQTAVTDASGGFRITLLPPGDYKLAVQLEGYKPAERSDISLSIDKTLRANLTIIPEVVQVEEQVVRTGIAPVINVGSAETGSVVTKEFVANIPVGRSFDQLAVVAPSASGDLYGVGFAGAQSAENSYILDGLSVGSPAFGTLSGTSAIGFIQSSIPIPSLLSDFVDEVDVKTGAFMPEYGRSTGGVVNVVSKSGSNEFHGALWGTLRPDSLVGSETIPAGRAGEALWVKQVPKEGAYYTDFGGQVGGPIMQDKLWFYLGFSPILQKQVFQRYYRANELDGTGAPVRDANGAFVQRDLAGTGKKYDQTNTSYQAVGKLTYLLNENNNFSIFGFVNPYTETAYNATNSAESFRTMDFSGNTYDVVGKYGGKFADKRLILEGTVGWHHQRNDYDPKSVTFADAAGNPVTVSQDGDPRIRYRNVLPLGTFEAVPADCAAGASACRVQNYISGGFGFTNKSTSDNYQGKLALSYLLEAGGSHTLKGGIDLSRNYYEVNKNFSGGGRFDYRLTGGARGFLMDRSYGKVIGPTGAFSDNLADVTFAPAGTKSLTQSNAYFIQDSWQVGSTGLTLNLGVRFETQSMEDTRSAISPKISINDNIAPRAALIYDFTRTGRSKVAVNWGRFYEMIPLDMGDRSFGSETLVQALYRCSAGVFTPGVAAFDPRKSASCPAGNFGVITDNYGNPATYAAVGGVSPIAPDLKGMYVDQFGGSIEYEVLSDLSVGVEYAGRRLGRAIEDMSSNDGLSYFIANPGESQPWDFTFPYYTTPDRLNPQVVNAFDPVTHRTVQVPFPKPERKYDGITFKVVKNFSKNWQGAASYTRSSLRGNYAGLFRAENGQLDPNITSEYDLPTLMTNKNGPLPGDTPHVVKLFGSYTWNAAPAINVTGGVGFTGSSGTPVSILGAHPLYGNGEAWIVPRGMGGRTPFIWRADLKAGFEYVIAAPYAVRLTVDLFNVFNKQAALLYDENYTFDTVQPIVGSTCKNKDSAGKPNAIAAAQADCPDLKYLKTTDGNPVTVNQNFGQAQATSAAYQVPFSMRVGLALTF